MTQQPLVRPQLLQHVLAPLAGLAAPGRLRVVRLERRTGGGVWLLALRRHTVHSTAPSL